MKDGFNVKIDHVDSIRDAAILLSKSDPELALDLINIAAHHRPEGPVIKTLYSKLKLDLGKKSFALIGNCQMSPLASLLESKSERVIIDKVISAHLYKHTGNKIYKTMENADFIVTQPISNKYEGINTALLKEIYGKKVVTVPNLFFEGFHQDWTYIPIVNGNRLKGPLGDYHNKSVLEGFLKSFSIEKVYENYFSKEYNERNYSHILSSSLQELVYRERDIDIKMSDVVLEEARGGNECFHTFNHPNKHLLNIEAIRILSFLGIEVENHEFDGDCLDDVVLRTNPVIQGGRMKSIIKNGNKLDFLDFIKKSYEIYENNPAFIKAYAAKCEVAKSSRSVKINSCESK